MDLDGKSRRQFFSQTASLASGLWLASGRSAPAAPKIIKRTLIDKQPHIYHGWPTLARKKDGELILVCSGGRESHVCPFGRVDFLQSKDQGFTWSYPRTLVDSAIDDRDAGILETANGSLLVTTFTSLAYEPNLKKDIADSSASKERWTKAKLEKLARWKGARDRLSEAERNAQLGTWMIRSENGGIDFSAPYRVPVNSPHGPIQVSDGRILYAGKALWTEAAKVGVAQSTDDGKTWSWLADIPTRQGDDHRDYHELHAVELTKDHLIAHIRNHNKRNAGETLQSESTDGGKSWSEPHEIGVWGLPSHLLRLRDGRLMMSYGHRRKPLGNQVRISDDGGKSWSEPSLLSDDGVTGDLGYPSTVELDDGSFVSVWYEVRPGNPMASLRMSKWKLEG